MQGTQVQSLVQEAPTCCGATKPRALQLLKPKHPGAHALQREATTMRSLCPSVKRSPYLLQLEKART